MMPMTDLEGKRQTDAFDFTITADTSRTLDIPYYITVRRTADSFADLDSVVKVYLTKVNMVNNEEQESDVILSKFSNLAHYENNQINIPLTEKTLHNDTVLAGTTNYTQKYRLRIWVDTDANYLVQTPTSAYCERNSDHETVTEIDTVAATEANCTGEDYTWHPADVSNTYPLNNKTYALTVNVYGEGNDIGESGVADRANTNIESISFTDSEDEFTLENGVYTGEAVMPAGQTSMNKTIVVDTENDNATVSVERLNSPTSMNIETSKMKKLSINIELELFVGVNNFVITVTGADGRTTHQHNLSINVTGGNFATDDWNTILANVIKDGGQKYAPVTGGKSVQPVKEITMTINGVTETHYLRVANTTTPSECSNSNFSQTACGFVIEFVDCITDSAMAIQTTENKDNLNMGGYPYSIVYNYLDNVLLDALPQEIKSLIIDTTVISKMDSTNYNPDNLEYIRIGSTDYFKLPKKKLFLFNKTEVGSNIMNLDISRKLDYYRINTKNDDRIKQKINSNGNLVNSSWWLNDPALKSNYSIVKSDGSTGNDGATWANCVSPAFRIGPLGTQSNN